MFHTNTARIVRSVRGIAASLFTTTAATLAVGIATGIAAPAPAQAQGLPGRYATNDGGNYLFGDKVPSDWGIAIPLFDNGIYETKKSTNAGYSITLRSQAAFGTCARGSYLFVVSPDGNYLFTNRSDGLLMTPGGWGMTRSGEIVDPKGNGLGVTKDGFRTPEAYVYFVAKGGSRGLILPDGTEFRLHDVVEVGMQPSGIFYD